MSRVYFVKSAPEVLPQIQCCDIAWGGESKRAAIEFENGGIAEAREWMARVRSASDIEIGAFMSGVRVHEIDLGGDRAARPFADLYYVKWELTTLGKFVLISFANGSRLDAREWARSACREMPGLTLNLTSIELEIFTVDLA